MSDDNKIDVILNAIDNSAPAFNELTKSLDQMKSQVSGVVSEITSKFEQLSSGVGIFGKALGGLGLASIIGTFAEMVSKTAEAGSQMRILSQEIGMASEKLGAFQYAAKQSGTNVEAFTRGLGLFAKNLYTTGDEGTKIGAVLKVMGLSADDAKKPMDELLLVLADKFANMKDGIGKTAIAMELFGRGGKEMIPVLNLGAEGIKKWTDEAKKLGIVFDQEASEAAHKFEQNLNTLKASAQGLAYEIGNKLIPILNDLFKLFKQDKDNIFTRKFLEWDLALAEKTLKWQKKFHANAEAIAATEERIKKDKQALYSHTEPGKMEGEKEDAPALPEKPDKSKDKSIVGTLEAELVARKVALTESAATENQFYEMSKAEEKAFWDNKLKTTKMSVEDRQNILKKSNELSLAISKQGFDEDLSLMKIAEDGYRKGSQERIDVAKARAKMLEGIAAAEPERYRHALAEVEAREREHDEALKQFDKARLDRQRSYENDMITLEKERLNLEVELGHISKDQEYAKLKEFETRSWTIQKQILDQEVALNKEGTAEYENALKKREEAQRKFALNIVKIDNQAAKTAQQQWKETSNTMASALTSAINGMESGSE